MPIEVVAGLFFVLIALMFVGLGQVMGRLFNAIPDRVSAYTVNILGSLAGITAFGLASYFRTPPVVWFGRRPGLCLLLRQPLDGRCRCSRRWPCLSSIALMAYGERRDPGGW